MSDAFRMRRIVSDIVSDGGLPPLMIEPIDFAALYRTKMMEAQNQVKIFHLMRFSSQSHQKL